MMTTASIAARSTEFVRENFSDKDFNSRTEVWENRTIAVSHVVTLPVGNLQAVMRVTADEKFVCISMVLCADALLATTALFNQTEIRPEELDAYLAHHYRTLMDLAHEYIERVAAEGDATDWALPLTPADILNPPF